jgi:hypothetical protein
MIKLDSRGCGKSTCVGIKEREMQIFKMLRRVLDTFPYGGIITTLNKLHHKCKIF